jgi:hypothetical protein
MQTGLSPLVNVYQTQLEASRRFADAIFSGTEKIDRVMLDAIHRVFNHQLTFVQAMTSARDPQTAATMLQSKLLSRSPDDTMNYQKELMRIFAEMQNDISKSLQDYVEQLGSTAASGGALPMGGTSQQVSDAVYNPVTSVFSVWESAFKEAAALARKNMAGARTAIDDASRSAAENAASMARVPGNAMEDAAATASRLVGSGSLSGKGASGGDGEDSASERGGGSSGSSSGRRK